VSKRKSPETEVRGRVRDGPKDVLNGMDALEESITKRWFIES